MASARRLEPTQSVERAKQNSATTTLELIGLSRRSMDLDNAAKLKIFSAEHRELVKIAADSGLCTSPVARVVAISVLLCGHKNNPWFSIIFATQQQLPDFIAPHWRWLNMASDSPNNPGLKTPI